MNFLRKSNNYNIIKTLENFSKIYYNNSMNYEQVSKIVDKEVIPMKELHSLMNCELIKSVKPCKEDKRHPKHLKYEIRLINEEFYWVYVKEKKLLWF